MGLRHTFFSRLRYAFFMRLRHYPYLFKTVVKMYDHLPMVLSVSLHLFVVFFLTYEFATATKDAVVSVPIFVVDLEKVKIAEMTNLPPKLVENTQKKTATGAKSVKTSSYSKAPSASSGTRVEGNSSSGSSSSGKSNPSTGAHLESDLNAMLKRITSDKPNKASKSKSKGNTAKSDDSFKTLLASVDGIKGGLGYSSEPPDLNKDEVTTSGIEGGSGGSYMQELTVSEKDMIGIKLRECWNLDAGARGAHNMLIEIRVFLNKDGKVKDAKILDSRRYDKDAAFRSVAESARRAVYICDKKEETSPFRIFPKHYEQSYDDWQTLLLRFNPFDGGIG